QRMAPGMNGSRSLLSDASEVKMPMTSTVHAAQRTDPNARNPQCKRLRLSTASSPSPTSDQAGMQKKGIVTVCQACIENARGWLRKYEAAGADRGAPMSAPGRLRFTIVWKRRSDTVAIENSNCPDLIEALPWIPSA